MLTDAQIERYSRQILLPQVGGRGQERLLAARAAVVGAGPAAAMATTLLVRAGVTTVPDTSKAPLPDLVVGLLEHRDDVRDRSVLVAGPGQAKRPCVFGSLRGNEILVATLVGRPCLRCFPFCLPPGPGQVDAQTTTAAARLALGALAANEGLRVLLSSPACARTTRLCLASGEGTVTDIAPTDGCAACGGRA